MISSIEINRFRGIREGKLENLTPLTILVGPNGCGKSSVLDAMLIGASPDTHLGIIEAVQRHPGVFEGAHWIFSRPNENEQCKITTFVDDIPKHCVIEGFPAFGTGEIQIKWSICDNSGNLLDKGSGVFRPKTIFSTRRRVISNQENAQGIRIIECHREQQPLARLVSAVIESGRISQIMLFLRELVPAIRDIRILAEKSPTGDRPIVHFVFDQYTIPVALSGDGIYAVTRLVVELASLQDGVALIEEPEVHQHPGAMWQTVRAIWAAVRRNVQVVLTTHSLEFIDMVLAEAKEGDIERLSLFRLGLEKGRLIAVRTSGEDVAFCRGDIQEDLR